MWYDVFSLVYDHALEDLYRPFRKAAVDALRLQPGDLVIDLPCGTGQSLDEIVAAIGPTGRVLGVDRSRGMLRRAHRRADRAGWDNVVLRQVDSGKVDAGLVADSLGRADVDGILCALGLTALPNWEDTFEQLFALLRPGGRFVLFDVHAPVRTRQSRTVELMARADLSRQAWLPLMERCPDFQREVFEADPDVFGGELYVASGSNVEANH